MLKKIKNWKRKISKIKELIMIILIKFNQYKSNDNRQLIESQINPR